MLEAESSLDQWLSFGDEDEMFHLERCYFGMSNGDAWL